MKIVSNVDEMASSFFPVRRHSGHSSIFAFKFHDDVHSHFTPRISSLHFAINSLMNKKKEQEEEEERCWKRRFIFVCLFLLIRFFETFVSRKCNQFSISSASLCRYSTIVIQQFRCIRQSSSTSHSSSAEYAIVGKYK